MFSDRFANLARPDITTQEVVHGTRVTVPKSWGEYTDAEKARCVAYRAGGGDDYMLMLLFLEREVAGLQEKAKALQETAREIDAKVTETNAVIDGLRRLHEAKLDDLDARLAKVEATFPGGVPAEQPKPKDWTPLAARDQVGSDS